MLNNILNNVENMEELDHMVTAEDINEMGFVLVKYSDGLAPLGIIYAGMTIAKFENDVEAPVVMIDYNFEDLSRNAQAFMLNHELGHYKLQRDLIVQQEQGLFRTIDIEFEADEYAAEQIGKENAIDALIELKEAMINDLFIDEDSIGIKEVETRIENLRK